MSPTDTLPSYHAVDTTPPPYGQGSRNQDSTPTHSDAPCASIVLVLLLLGLGSFIVLNSQLIGDATRRDEEYRKHAGLRWVDLKADQRCLSRQSRRYTAELINVPMDHNVDGLKWCMETQIEIHGDTYERPERCVRDGGGKIIAEWITHSNEPTCNTFWGHLNKKECSGYHTRIFEAKLENHQQPWDNWREMCFSTPAYFNFGHRDHPDVCREAGRHGIFGSWFVFDEECL